MSGRIVPVYFENKLVGEVHESGAIDGTQAINVLATSFANTLRDEINRNGVMADYIKVCMEQQAERIDLDNLPPAEPEHDPVNHPKHYTSHPSGIECIEITRHMGFNLGNAVKYIWRDGLKDAEVPIQDLKKALWYLQDEIKLRESK